MRVSNPMDNEDTRRKMRLSRKGQQVSPGTQFKKGNVPWWILRGLPHPTSDPRVVEKIREARLKQVIPKEDTKEETKHTIAG